MNELKSRLEECFATVFADAPREQLATLSADSHADWDSLATLTLVSVVEEEFSIEIPTDAAAQLLSFESMLNYLRDLGNSVGLKS